MRWRGWQSSECYQATAPAPRAQSARHRLRHWQRRTRPHSAQHSRLPRITGTVCTRRAHIYFTESFWQKSTGKLHFFLKFCSAWIFFVRKLSSKNTNIGARNFPFFKILGLKDQIADRCCRLVVILYNVFLDCTSAPAKWRLNPSNGLSRVHYSGVARYFSWRARLFFHRLLFSLFPFPFLPLLFCPSLLSRALSFPLRTLPLEVGPLKSS